MTRITTAAIWLVAGLGLLPAASWALSTDRKQPMSIEADRVELNDGKGVSVYRGNVKVTQGTLVLTGQTMTVYNKGDHVEKVIMQGNPATYTQLPDNKKQNVRAKALRMEYYTNPERIILLKNAQVEQEGDILKSERIEYDVARDKVNAGTDQPNERVHITLQPRPQKKKQETPEP
jgi:lipopolysaccharide export system protein LptA